MNRMRLARYAASAAILAVFIFLVEHWVGWTRLLRPWLSVPPAAVGGAALLFAGSHALRALRVFDYFRGEMRGAFALCLKLTLTHNLLNHLLPMRAGELGFPLLMSRWFGIGGVRSVSVLLWFRLLDAHTLAGFAIAAWFWPAALPWFALPFFLRRKPGAARGLASRFLRGKPLAVARQAVDSWPQSQAAFLRAWAWTLLNWGVKIGVFAWVLRLFAEVPAAAAVTAAALGDATSILPIHGIAGAGTYEAGVVAGLTLASAIPPRTALAAAVNLHLFILGAVFAGGIVALLIPRRRG